MKPPRQMQFTPKEYCPGSNISGGTPLSMPLCRAAKPSETVLAGGGIFYHQPTALRVTCACHRMLLAAVPVTAIFNALFTLSAVTATLAAWPQEAAQPADAAISDGVMAATRTALPAM